MPARIPPTDTEVRDLEVLIRAHHPLIVLDAEEEERATTLVHWVADRLDLPYVSWGPTEGLLRPDVPSFEVPDSKDPLKCLDFILDVKRESIYHLKGFFSVMEDALVTHKLVQVAHHLFNHQGAVIITASAPEIPTPLQRVVTSIQLSTPTHEQYYAFVTNLFTDLRRRMPVEVKLSGRDVERLLNQLSGLTLFEVKKVLTKLLVEDSRFTAEDISKIGEAKKEIVARSGVLEYFSTDEGMREVAGLANLKSWLGKRKLAFTDAKKAKQFGLTAPKGVLLLGVQGCGKSLCAKAIASEWGLPLIRLDPSNLYTKYFGESERNLKRAIKTAESMAPIVLWIDEIEKAFSHGGDQDSGTSSRIFGTLLAWMQDKKEGVFVIATSNDISKLPPELVRKGRFDEIFFVDLPSLPVRREILSLHLVRRDRDPTHFDLEHLATRMVGFSGAEIEQVVLSSLYSAFAQKESLSTQLLEEEIERTVPLSVTAAEKIERLREWAGPRAVPADT